MNKTTQVTMYSELVTEQKNYKIDKELLKTMRNKYTFDLPNYVSQLNSSHCRMNELVKRLHQDLQNAARTIENMEECFGTLSAIQTNLDENEQSTSLKNLY